MHRIKVGAKATSRARAPDGSLSLSLRFRVFRDLLPRFFAPSFSRIRTFVYVYVHSRINLHHAAVDAGVLLSTPALHLQGAAGGRMCGLG